MTTANLEVMKQLRSIGASIKLQDDVAKKVGGYDSPLFLPTVEFIVKIQQVFKGQGKEQDRGMQTAPLPNAFDPQAFYGVDLDSAKDVVAIGGGNKKNKKQSIKYIDSRIDERNDFLDKNPDFDAEKNLIPRRKKDKKQQQLRTEKKSHIISFLANVARAAIEQIAQVAQNARQNNRSTQQQQNQTQQNVQRQQSQRRNMLNAIRNKKNILDHAHDHDHHHEHHEEHQEKATGKENEQAGKKPTKEDFLKNLKKNQRIAELHENMEKNGHKITDHDLLNAAKTATKELGNVSKDIIISKMINDIKNGAGKETGMNKAEPSREQMISEAAAKLDMVGVKPVKAGEPQINNKKALAEQQQQMSEQKQRT